jgi:hypothetical protein
MSQDRWMQDAVPPSHEGIFTAKAKRAGESVGEYAQEHKHDSGTLGAQARFAINARRIARRRAGK